MFTLEQQEFLRSLLSRARLRSGTPNYRATQSQTFIDEQRSGAGPDERDPVRISGLIDAVILNKGWDLQLATGKLRANWVNVVGQENADHIVIEEFQLNPSGHDGVLILRADSTAWATQMKLLLPTLEKRLEEQIGIGRVSDIKILGPSAPSWKHGLRSVAGRGPRDTYG